jgi:hypothetical protein
MLYVVGLASSVGLVCRHDFGLFPLSVLVRLPVLRPSEDLLPRPRRRAFLVPPRLRPCTVRPPCRHWPHNTVVPRCTASPTSSSTREPTPTTCSLRLLPRRTPVGMCSRCVAILFFVSPLLCVSSSHLSQQRHL